MNNAVSQTEEGHNHFEGMTVPVAIWGGGGLDTQVCDITSVVPHTYIHTYKKLTHCFRKAAYDTYTYA